MSIPVEDFPSDSDSDIDTNPDRAQYLPISSDSDTNSPTSSPPRPNGLASIPSLHIADANGVARSDPDGEAREDEDTETDEASMRTAFRDDERRRNAPLTEENAVRVMDAMRGVRFEGSVPDWVGSVPEERWIGQLRSLRVDGQDGVSRSA